MRASLNKILLTIRLHSSETVIINSRYVAIKHCGSVSLFTDK